MSPTLHCELTVMHTERRCVPSYFSHPSFTLSLSCRFTALVSVILPVPEALFYPYLNVLLTLMVYSTTDTSSMILLFLYDTSTLQDRLLQKSFKLAERQSYKHESNCSLKVQYQRLEGSADDKKAWVPQ